MNKLAVNSQPHLQIVEVPRPLEVHPSVSPLAAELLMKTAERLGERPSGYNQGNFTGHHDCKTPCCILGHCAAAAGLKLAYDQEGNLNAGPLGLTPTQYRAIFWTKNWPSCTPANPDMNSTTTEQAIARIEHFLSTGQ